MHEPDLETVFLGYLDPDPSKSEEAYLALRKKLILFFRSRNCSDPDDLADEVVMRTVKRCVEPLQLDHGFAAYVFGVAKFVLMEKYKKPDPEPLPEGESQSRVEGPNAMQPTEMAIELKEHLDRLTAEERHLLIGYVSEDRTQLADRLGMTANALRVRVSRIRDKLKQAPGAASLKKGAVA